MKSHKKQKDPNNDLKALYITHRKWNTARALCLAADTYSMVYDTEHAPAAYTNLLKMILLAKKEGVIKDDTGSTNSERVDTVPKGYQGE